MMSSMSSSEGDVRFHWVDYLMLCATLVLSCVVGVYYGIKGRKKSTADDYLMAGRNMSIFPVSFSIFVSTVSSIAFLGDPVEVYYYGGIYWLLGIGISAGLPIIAHYFAPILYRMRLTSVYEYLEIRYNAKVRIVCSVIAGIGLMLFMGVVLYAPSLALSQVSGLDVWLSIVVIGAVCTFYTSLGGMKAVLWADTMQFFIMVSGLAAILIQGTIKLGGISNVWRICEQGGRINFFQFSPNPFVRSTFWIFLIGGIFRVVNPYISGQVWVQRYCTLKSERDVKIAIYLNIPLFLLFLTLFTGNGLVLYAYYSSCDPLRQGRVQKPDQMIPLLVLELFQFLPGISGLFVGSIVSASLSTLSSGQSGLAATCLSDVIQPMYTRCRGGNRMPDKISAIVAKLLSAVFGVLNIILALFMMLAKGSTVFQLSLSFVNATFGPAAGIYIVGILFPFINTASAVAGCLISLVISCWLTIGTLITGVYHPRLPTATDGCSLVANMTFANMANGTISKFNDTVHVVSSTSSHSRSAFNEVYKFSPLLYPALGPIINIVCSLLISAAIVGYHRIRTHFGSQKTEEKSEDVTMNKGPGPNLALEPVVAMRTTTL